MKKSKWLALAGVSLLSVGVLVACSSKSNTSSNTYNYVYTADPETLDYLISNKGSTTDAVTNGVDGLLENDKYGNLVPAIAKDWTVSDVYKRQGDGMLLSAFHMYEKELARVRFVGIHTGHLGFYTDYLDSEVDQLIETLRKDSGAKISYQMCIRDRCIFFRINQLNSFQKN